jgi:hypothetical protein
VCSSQREAIFIDGESMVHIKEEKEQALLTRNRRQIVGILVSLLVVFRGFVAHDNDRFYNWAL